MDPPEKKSPRQGLKLNLDFSSPSTSGMKKSSSPPRSQQPEAESQSLLDNVTESDAGGSGGSSAGSGKDTEIEGEEEKEKPAKKNKKSAAAGGSEDEYLRTTVLLPSMSPKKASIFHYKASVTLPSGDFAEMAASNNDLFGDPDIQKFYNGIRKNWRMGKGWAYLRVTTKSYYEAPRSGFYQGKTDSGAGSERGDKKFQYLLMSDINTIYNFLKDPEGLMSNTLEKARVLATEWNSVNSHGNTNAIQRPERKECLDYREGCKQYGAQHRCYLMMVLSTWHFSDYVTKTRQFKRMNSDCSGVKLQLKYAGKDFAGTSRFRSGGFNMWVSDLRTLLYCDRTLAFLKSLESDPKVGLQSKHEYFKGVNSRLAQNDFASQMLLDLKPDNYECESELVEGDSEEDDEEEEEEEEDEEEDEEWDETRDPDFEEPSKKKKKPKVAVRKKGNKIAVKKPKKVLKLKIKKK